MISKLPDDVPTNPIYFKILQKMEREIYLNKKPPQREAVVRFIKRFSIEELIIFVVVAYPIIPF